MPGRRRRCYAALISGVAGMQAVCSLTCAQREGETCNGSSAGKFAVGRSRLALLAAGPAAAQADAAFAKAIADYPDLEFASTYADPGQAGSKGNSLYKPQGAGPFRRGAGAYLWRTAAAYGRAGRELVAAGFVVLLLDSYGPRRHTAFCQPRGVRTPRVYKDAFDGMRHLASLKEVDPARIYLVGMSLGSFAASVAASPQIAKAVGSERRFRASVGWYGSCAYVPKNAPTLQLLHPDTDRPVLLLLARDDKETPIAPCFPVGRHEGAGAAGVLACL